MFRQILLVTALVALVGSNPTQNRLSELRKLITPFEENCIRQGGMCMHYKDCPDSNMVNVFMRQSLCLEQANLGAVCCYFGSP